MCWKNKSFTIDARWTCRFTGVVRTFRAPESKSVPLHRASRHAWIDINLSPSPEKLALYIQIDEVTSELGKVILLNKAIISMHRRSKIC
jgi:hypothetical protein